MNPFRRRLSIAAGLLLPVGTLCASASFAMPASAQAGAVTTTAPHIVARPVDVMVDQPVALHGTGFTPNSTLVLTECSKRTWIVPQNPCLHDNQVTVTTNRSGGFNASMKAEVCPPVSPPRGTERTCYIGVVQPNGVDTIELLGAARIVVSWP